MPIEIKELHVKINVDAEKRQSPMRQKKNASKDLIVAECVEQVMTILSNSKER